MCLFCRYSVCSLFKRLQNKSQVTSVDDIITWSQLALNLYSLQGLLDITEKVKWINCRICMFDSLVSSLTEIQETFRVAKYLSRIPACCHPKIITTCNLFGFTNMLWVSEDPLRDQSLMGQSDLFTQWCHLVETAEIILSNAVASHIHIHLVEGDFSIPSIHVFSCLNSFDQYKNR